MGFNNRDSGLKFVAAAFIALTVLVLGYIVVSDWQAGSNLYYHGKGMSAPGGLLGPTLVLLVKLLWLIFITSLIIGVVLVIKKYLFEERRGGVGTAGQLTDSGYACPCCGTDLTTEFRFCPKCKASLKDLCQKCGRDLQVGWKCCPLCGTDRKHQRV